MIGAELRRQWPVAAALLLFSVLLIALKLVRVDQMQGDSALFFQVTDHIAHHGTPMSQLFASIWTYQQSGLIKLPASALAHVSLAPPSGADENILRLHTYFILFPLGWLAAIFPVRLVLFSAEVFAFTGVLAAIYALLVKRGVPVAATCVFCLAVVTYPAWGQALLYGQFYPDRLFVGFAFAMILLAASNGPRWALALALAGCICVNERGALVAGLGLTLYVALYWNAQRDRAFKLALGLGALIVGFVLLKFVVFHNYYDAFVPSSPEKFVRWLGNPKFRLADATLLLVNLPLLILAAFEWRAGVIAAIVLLPNLIGSFGGAEKFGWTSHYHSFYMPFLLWAATLGLIRLSTVTKPVSGRTLALAAPLAALLYFGLMDPYARPARFGPQYTLQTFIPEFLHDVPAYFGPFHAAFVTWSAMIEGAVPKGSIVSLPESAMPYLYPGRTLYFIPMGIDEAGYVVLDVEQQGARTTYGGVLSARSGDEPQRVNEAVLARMKRDGFDLADPTIVPGLGYAIFHRRH